MPSLGQEVLELLRDALLKLGLVLLMAAMLVLLPVLLPLGLAAGWLDDRRVRAAACRTACSRCGRILGREALEIADKAWTAEVQAMFAANPGMRLWARIVRTLHAVCPACGARYRYDEAARLFGPTPDAPTTATGSRGGPPPVLERRGSG